jgi:phosphatidyl-myo-inositol alpha-mannosyltransferase
MAAQKLKIGFVFDDSLDRNDGVQQYIKTVGTWLASEGHQVRYLVGETKLQSWAGGTVYSLAKNMHVRFNANRLSIPRPASKKAIQAVLDKEHFDILHIQMPHSPLFSQRVLQLADPRTAVIGTFHILPAGRLQHFGSRLLRQWYGRTITRFDTILAVSEPAKVFAEETYHLHSEVLPNVVDTKRFFVASPKRSKTVKRIVFLGRLVKRKGATELINAVANVVHVHGIKNIELIIAGDGPERAACEHLISGADLTPYVKLLGFIPEADKPALLASADIAVFPSLYGESFGIVLIEAMAAGAGVVLGGNNPGYASVLQKTPEALFDPKDYKAFSALLKHYLTSETAAKTLHQIQQAEVKQFDVVTVGSRLMAIYRDAIQRIR